MCLGQAVLVNLLECVSAYGKEQIMLGIYLYIPFNDHIYQVQTEHLFTVQVGYILAAQDWL